jgi:hypothetical protein
MINRSDPGPADPVYHGDPLGIVVGDDFLSEAGLIGLPEQHRTLMLQFIHERLTIQVLATGRTVLSDAQAAEYDHLPYVDDEQRRLKWLAVHCSRYRRVVENEMSKLLEELRANAPDLLEISRIRSSALAPQSALEEVAHHG